MNPTIDPEKVPATYARCFLSNCPLSDRCLRHLAGQHLLPNQQMGPAVYPTALNGDQCPMFREIRYIRAAYGFKTLFKDVKLKDSNPLREALYQYLGSITTYYRYQRGERMLTPEQQQWILTLFASKGYTDQLFFEHYVDTYDFS